jgi:hypothetical protein
MATDVVEMLGSGALRMMQSVPARPVEYTLQLDGDPIPLSDLLGRRLSIRFDGKITCQNCGNLTRKSYGDGYCYPCFKTLARCDLCVVSPDRCHYAAGTCREPAWGESFCMQPHLVYLANSAGAKVGITKPENLPWRWLDQGATQAAVIMRTRSRFQAGCVEAALARYVSDRTDWRELIGRDAAEIDLPELAARLRRDAAKELELLDSRFAGALSWVAQVIAERFEYPVMKYASPANGLSLTAGSEIVGTLLGIKGQYLMFDSGVFNVRRHTSYHVVVARVADVPFVVRESVREDPRDQMELF